MDKIQKKQEQKNDSLNIKKKQKTRDGSREIGGPKGPEPTRYGDWERRGRCIDF
jgi:hypothetical protein